MKRLTLWSAAMLTLVACGGPPDEYGTVTSELIGAGRVIQLGDSYSAGVGMYADASDYDDPTCWREDDDTPAARVARARGGTLRDEACSGAETGDILSQFNRAIGTGDGSDTLIVLTAGGNNIRTKGGDNWPTLLRKCILGLSGCSSKDSNQVGNWASMESAVESMYRSMIARAPRANYRVLGYPRLMQPNAGSSGCPGVTGLSVTEANWFDANVDTMNAKLASLIARVKSSTGADIKFIDVSGYFYGGGACRRYQSDRMVNDRVGPLWDVSDASFHPSPKGWDAYYTALYNNL